MSSEHESIQPSQPNRIFAALRDVCAALYPEERNTRLIVADAGLDERQVAFSSRAQTNWHNILAEAIRGNRLDALLDVVRTAYPTNQPLQVAITSYHQFIAAGGHLDAPAQLPAGVDPYDVHGLANPYLGLRAFRYEDRVIYAGRDAKIREALEKLTEPGKEQAVLFVTGASGSGKSSFVQAGLLPRLQEHYQKRHKQVRIAIFRPRDQPLANLDDALSQLAPNASRDLAAFTPVEQINVLIIDQFEEVFTQAHLPVDAEFFQWLQEAPAFQPGRTHIIATVRSDYLNELFNLTKLYDLNRYGLNLRTMTVDELSETIQRPLQECFPNGERRFEPALVQKLAQDASLRPTLLPLLQVTLQKLWKQGSLKLAAYTNLTDAIQERAEEVYLFSDHINVDPQAPRPARDQQELMGILLDLIHVAVDDTDRRDVRQPRTRRELEQSSAHRPRLIEELVNARLLSAASETRNGEDVEVIDIIHESLIDNWGRLRNAIEEQRQQLQRRARFKLWLGEWLRNGRQDGYLLLTDMQLAEARALVEERDIEVQGEEAQALYRRSVEWREAEREKELQRARELAEAQRQRARVFRNGVVVASLLFLLAAVAAGFSYYLNSELSNTNGTLESTNAELDRKNDELNSSNKKLDNSLTQLNASNAQLQQTIAETQRLANIAFSRQLAAQSISELNKDRYEPAILLAIAAGQITDTLEAFSSIRLAIANPSHSRLVLYGHTGAVYQAIWNQNESKILTSSADDTARVWDAATGKELLRIDGHTGDVRQVSWNQDESKILTSSDDRTARIWDAATGKEFLRFDGHKNWVLQAIWNQDESKILTSSADDTARIWDAVTGKELLRLDGHTGDVRQVSWNQDESKILTRSADNTARIWDTVTGKELPKLDGHTNWVLQAIWNQDESKLLTSSADYTARIWDAVTGKELLRLDGHTGAVLQAIWNQDESKLLTRSADYTARIWDTVTGKELVRLGGHTGDVRHVSWNQDGSKLLTSSADNTARIWDAVTGKELFRLDGHTGDVRQVSWNHDESKLLTSSDDRTARIWDAVTGKELLRLDGLNDEATQATWSYDGSRILTSSGDWHGADDTARIWDAVTGKELLRLDGPTDTGWQATWNHDESRILTSSDDGTVRIWYVQMKDLLVAGCKWAPRNFTWSEWSQYMEDNVGAYRLTCPNAPIPPDAIAGIQDEVRQLIRNGEIDSATQRLTELNGWLQVNGQFKNYSVDVDAFVAEVSATATAAALPPTATPTPVAP